jgi:ribosomal protein S12 methylthiotransferase
MSKQKVSVISLGCSKNTVDSERLMKQIQLNQFQLVSNPEEADTVVINTCGFIEPAKRESIDTIMNAVGLKNIGKIRKVIVIGCLTERYEIDLKKEIPEVDAFYGTEQYEKVLTEIGGSLKYELLGERLLTTPHHTAYLKISEGCDHPCSFCAIPLMRGKHKTKPIEDLISETKRLVSQGTKELVLIGQDTTDYGIDLYGKRNLADLMNHLSDIDGIEWIRLMYAYPSHFSEDIIKIFAENPKICKYIDIPLQHISDRVLKSMRRGITKHRTIQLLNRLRENIPGLVLRTTIISGYPEEDKIAFEELCSFISEFKFERLGVFPFSLEENTSSFVLGDRITEKEKLRRQNIILKIQQQISLEKNEQMLGRELKILVDRKEGDFYIGRSYREAPEVDGEILIPIASGNKKPGNFYNLKITDFDEYDLYADNIKNEGTK